jgi:hypothetical protein
MQRHPRNSNPNLKEISVQHIAILRLKPEATEEAQAQYRRAEVEKVIARSSSDRALTFYGQWIGFVNTGCRVEDWRG